MENNEKKEMKSIYDHYKKMYRVEWVPNKDFDYEGNPKYYEDSPCLIIYFSKKKQYAILADVDEVNLYKKITWLKKEKWVSVTHNHPNGDFTDDGTEIIKAVDYLIARAR